MVHQNKWTDSLEYHYCNIIHFMANNVFLFTCQKPNFTYIWHWSMSVLALYIYSLIEVYDF